MVQRYKVKGDDKRDLLLECCGGKRWTVIKGGSAWSLKRGAKSIKSKQCRNAYRITFEVEGVEQVMTIHSDFKVTIGAHQGILTSL